MFFYILQLIHWVVLVNIYLINFFNLPVIGVIVSLALIEYFKWYIADPITSSIISVLIFMSVIPLIKSTGELLLQSYPQKYEKKMRILIENVKLILQIIKFKID